MLTPRQDRFVQEYLKDLNATQAAIRAGYSAKTAESIASRLLRNVKVAKAIERGQVARAQKVGVTAERVVQELARLAFSDVGELFDGEALRSPSELPEDIRRAVAGVEITRQKRVTKVDEDNVETDITDDVRKVKLWDKPRALELLARHLGILKDSIEHKGIPPFVLRVSDDE